MTYVIVNDGNLSGSHRAPRVPAVARALLAGPLRITVEHDGRIGALGATTTQVMSSEERVARSELTLAVEELFTELQYLLQEGIDELTIGNAKIDYFDPLSLISIATRQDQKAFLQGAQDRLGRDAGVVIDVVNDLSIPIDEVGRRLADFEKSYREAIQAQLSNARKGIWESLWDDFWRNLERLATKGGEKVAQFAGRIAAAGAEAGRKALSTSPTMILLGTVLTVGVIAYAWRSFR